MALTLPIQAPIFKESDFQGEGLGFVNQWMTKIAQTLNSLAGHAGPVSFANGINLNGSRISNAGKPLDPSDVVTLDYANEFLSPAAIQPQLEATSANPLQTYRQLNSKMQREKYSSFLNGILNTAPTANTGTLGGVPVGGSVDVTVNAGFHQRVDGSIVPFGSRTDALPLTASFSISSISRTGDTVTAILGSSFTGVAGDQINVGGTGDSSFQGTFIVNTAVGATITYSQVGPNASSSGGTVALLAVYYYTIAIGQNHLGLVAGPAADTWSQRVLASLDGTTIIAIAVINNLGLDPINSAAGATPPQTGAAIPVIRRL